MDLLDCCELAEVRGGIEAETYLGDALGTAAGAAYGAWVGGDMAKEKYRYNTLGVDRNRKVFSGRIKGGVVGGLAVGVPLFLAQWLSK
jgi:hypothetical protein